VGQGDPEKLVEDVRAEQRVLRDLPGASGVTGALRDLGRALEARGAGPEAAAEAVATTRAAAAWRADAAEALAPRLAALEELTRRSLGLREQPRLARPDALRVAGCLAQHRDVSLNF